MKPMTAPCAGMPTACLDTLDGLPDAIMVLNHTEAVTHLNRQARMLLCRDDAVAPPVPIWHFVAPASRAEIREITRNTLSAAECPYPETTFEVTLRRSDASTFLAEMAVGRLPAPQALLAASFRDITARKDSEARMVRLLSDAHESRQRVESLAAETIAQAEALAASESRLSMVLHSVRDGYWDWDVRNKVVHSNPQFAEILGLDAPNGPLLSPDAITALVIDADRADMAAALRRHLRGQTQNLIHECRVSRKDGTLAWIEFRGQVISRDSRGRALRATGLITDISEKKQLDQERRRTMKMEAIGELAAGVAHEINTPLQFVGDNLAFLQSQTARATKAFQLVADIRTQVSASPLWRVLGGDLLAAADEADLSYARNEIPEAIREALDGLDRVSKIVQALKEFSHQGPSERVAVDLNRMIENTVTLTRNEWKYVAEIETDLEPGLPHVHCVPHECGQLLVNLVVNAAHAIRAMADGKKGLLTIVSRAVAGQVEIRVSDTGCGIPPEIRNRIFDPFFTTKPIGQGTGQGLALAQATVKRHRGTISFQSEIGRGTVFSVRLPIDAIGTGDETDLVR